MHARFVTIKVYEPEISVKALGLLYRMKNVPEANNCTADELIALCESDEPDTVKLALAELCRFHYVVENKSTGVYALNIKMMDRIRSVLP